MKRVFSDQQRRRQPLSFLSTLSLSLFLQREKAAARELWRGSSDWLFTPKEFVEEEERAKKNESSNAESRMSRPSQRLLVPCWGREGGRERGREGERDSGDKGGGGAPPGAQENGFVSLCLCLFQHSSTLHLFRSALASTSSSTNTPHANRTRTRLNPLLLLPSPLLLSRRTCDSSCTLCTRRDGRGRRRLPRGGRGLRSSRASGSWL